MYVQGKSSFERKKVTTRALTSTCAYHGQVQNAVLSVSQVLLVRAVLKEAMTALKQGTQAHHFVRL